MKAPGKIVFSGLIVIIAALASGSLILSDRSGKTSSEYEGLTFLKGLTDSVTVYRDERGMPHIYATNDHDMYMAVGYISAGERLWQMDLIRRSATGRMSELFGKSYIQADIFSRCLQITEKSRQILKSEDPEIVACLQAYADGVNEYINTPGRKLPLEFRILSYKPEPWRLEDIMCIIGLMGWSLDSRNLSDGLFYYQLVSKLGVEKAADLIPEWKEIEDIKPPDLRIDESLIHRTRSFVSSFERVLKLGVVPFSGSNNWAVAGDRTESGKPLVSNDMHLSLNLPCIWLQVHQVIPGKLNVTGVLIPGMPFIVAGHNEKIAWGLTNFRVDGIDLFAERINPENRKSYLLNGEWKDIVIKPEIIKVRGGKHDTVNVSFTHRGPIISGLLDFGPGSMKYKWLGYDYLSGLKNFEDVSLSMKWSGYDISDEARSMYLLNRASGWDDFRSALRSFISISQNFIYADTDGNIALHGAGGIPLRKGNGIMIRNGETDAYDWKGYVPFENLPVVMNPENGHLSSANNKTVGDDYPYFIGHSFDVPYRKNRIEQLLEPDEKFSTDDFKRMINDQHSYLAALLTPHILRLTQWSDSLTKTEKDALDALAGWDYDMNTSLTAPTVFEFFRVSFKKNLLSDELGDINDRLSDLTTESYVYRLLTGGPDQWVDNVNTPGEETLDDIVLQSFEDGVGELTKQLGKNPDKWKWGRVHTITLVHPLGSVKLLGSLFNLNSDKYPIGGSDHTISPYYSLGTSFNANIGASVKHIYNTGDWDDSWSVIPGGSSGVPGSEFYSSQVKTYLEGNFYRDLFTENAVRSSAKYTLVIKPGTGPRQD